MGSPDIFHPDLFQGQVALVTGGGTGLGFAMAEYFGRHGARVAILGRRAAVLADARSKLEAQEIAVMAEAVDIRDAEAVAACVDRIYDAWGRLDVAVNNAGGQFPSPALDISPRGLDAVVRTNLYGTIYVSQAAARHMRKSGGGSIVNVVISSLERGIPGVAHTVAARAGVVGFMRTAAREWGPYGIRMNAIGPGLIVTPGFEAEMVQTGDPHIVDRTVQAIPLGRLGEPQDIVMAAAFLASPASAYITGQYLTVDGGNSLDGGISVMPPESPA